MPVADVLHESPIVRVRPPEIFQIIHSKFQVLEMGLCCHPPDPFRQMVHVIAEEDVLVVHDELLESRNPRDRSWLFHLLDVAKDRDQ